MAALRLSFVEEVSSLKWRVESGFNGAGKGTKGTQALRSVEELRGYATFYGRSTRRAQGATATRREGGVYGRRPDESVM